MNNRGERNPAYRTTSFHISPFSNTFKAKLMLARIWTVTIKIKGQTN